MDKEYAKYLLTKTTEDYNLIAEDYSRTRKEVWQEMEFLFEKYLNAGEVVLDLGCGNGRWLESFQKRKADYFGVDNSEKLVEIARRNYPYARLQVADILSLPFSDGFFDKIYSIAVLHHIPSYELRIKSLEEIKRVLKPRGLLVLTVWRFHQLEERWLIFKNMFLKLFGKSKLDWKDVLEPWGKMTNRYYHCFSKKELEELVKKSGFKVKESGVVKNERGNRQNIYLIAEN